MNNQTDTSVAYKIPEYFAYGTADIFRVFVYDGSNFDAIKESLLESFHHKYCESFLIAVENGVNIELPNRLKSFISHIFENACVVIEYNSIASLDRLAKNSHINRLFYVSKMN